MFVSAALRRAFRSEHGQAIIFVVLAMPMLLAVGSFVVDGTNLMVNRRAAQNAADSAALAAALSFAGLAANCSDGSTISAPNCAEAYSKFNTFMVSGWHECNDADPAHPTDTNCYAYPYVDRAGNTHDGQIEVRVRKSVAGFLTSAAGLSSVFDVSGRAVAGITSGPPPPYTFISLNGSCDNHTLVVRLGGQLTVTNKVYVDSCSGADGFDLFGVGGNLSAPEIQTVGGWETHNNDTVTIPIAGTVCGIGPHVSAPQTGPGCPITGAPILADPFIPLPTPVPGAQAWGSSTPVTVTRKALFGNVATLTTSTPHGLSVGDSISVVGVDSTFDGVYTVTAVPSATTVSYSDTGSNFPSFTVTSAQLTSGVATLTTSAPHTFAVGDSVTITGVDNPAAAGVFNGTFTVASVPTPTTFTYARPRAAFTRTVSKKGLTGGVATLTLTADATHPLVAGDIFNVSAVDALLNGGPFTASAATATSVTYPDLATTNVPVASKALSGGTTATVITTVVHNLSVGNSVTVNTGDARFDGTYTVTAVGGAGKSLTYTVPAVVTNVTNKAVTAGTATLTLASAPPFAVGDTVTVNTGDGRIDGTFVVTAVNTAAKTFSYALSFPTTHWDVTANVATLTAASHGLSVGDSVTVSGYTGPQSFLNGTFTITAVTANTFSYALVHATQNGNNPGTYRIATLGSTAASGTATVTTVPTTASGGTVTVPGFIASGTAASGTVNASGNVAATTVSGTVTAPSAPAGGALAKNLPGSPGVPAPYTVASGSQMLFPGTYYGGICIGAANCLGSNCTAAPATVPVEYQPVEQLLNDISAGQISFKAKRGAGTVTRTFQIGDVIQIDSEQMTVTNVGPVAGQPTQTQVDVSRNPGGVLHTATTHILLVTTTPTATVTLSPGTYIMAGGGFHVCGASSLTAPHVLLYNTEDPSSNAFNTPGAVDQISIDTTGNVSLGPQTDGLYRGMTIFQDRNLDVATNRYNRPGDKCDTKSSGADSPPSPGDTTEWDVALASMATTSSPGPFAAGPLGSVSGTIYAPSERALFADSVSGTANLAVITGCIFIDGGNSTFAFQPSGLGGIGSSLTE